MKILLILLLTLFANLSAFGANISGIYRCNDGGILEVTQRSQRSHFYASLDYADGSASSLAEFRFIGKSQSGTMLRDDEDQYMGEVTIEENGSRLVLNFDSGKIVTCDK